MLSQGKDSAAAGLTEMIGYIKNRVIKHHMFKDSAAIFTVQIALAVFGLLLSAVLARSLSVEDMGRYALIFSYAAIGQITSLPGMNSVISKGILKDYDPIFYSALKRSVISSGAASLILLAAGGMLLFSDAAREIGLTMIMVSPFLPVSGFDKYESFFQGKREFVVSRKISFFSNLANLIVVGAAAFFTKSLAPVIAALIIIRIATIIFCFRVIGKMIVQRPADMEFERALLKQGWQISVVSIYNVIVGQLDRIILGAIDPKMLAVYHIGSILPRRIKDNIKVILVVPITYWAKLSKNENLKRIKKHGLKFFLLGSALSLIIWVIAPWFIPFLYGENYMDSVGIARWLSLTLPVLFLGTVVLTVDLYQGDTRFNQKVEIGTQTFYIIALAVLVPFFGIYGVVAAFVARAYVQHGFFPVFYLMKNRIHGGL